MEQSNLVNKCIKLLERILKAHDQSSVDWDAMREAKAFIEECKQPFKAVNSISACCGSPGSEKCEQCQEIGVANPNNH